MAALVAVPAPAANVLVGGIQPPDIDKIWPHVASLLERAMPPEHTLDSIRDALKSAKMQLWVSHTVGIHALMVTEVTLPDVLVVSLAGRGLAACWPHWDWFTAWARENGADFVRCHTKRKGLTRLLLRHGFRRVGPSAWGEEFILDL